MTGRTFDAFARQLGRRRALQALGTAAVATVSGVALADARKDSNKQKNKKQRKNIEKQALALCAGQVSQCQALIGSGSEQVICCQELADCDFGGLVACLNATANL